MKNSCITYILILCTFRFANTITAQFNGHTHYDQFYVYFNSSDSESAINVAFNGASITPFTGNNPSYKLFYIDSDTFVSIK